MICEKTGEEVDPIEVKRGVVRCPECLELLDEETLLPLAGRAMPLLRA